MSAPVIDAWHLPGIDTTGIESYDTRTFGAVELRTPRLRPGALTRHAARLKAARVQHLVNRPVRAIVAAIDAAVARLLGPGSFRKVLDRALPAATGLSPAMCHAVLEGMARDWRAPALHTLLAAEFGAADLLDGFAADADTAGRRCRVAGPPLITHIFAGNVPGVSVTSLIRALLVKSASLGKTGSGELVLAPLFAHALAEIDADLASCLGVLHWAGGTSGIEDEALAAGELVVVYGGAAAIRGVRARTPPQTPIVEHGPRWSFGLVGRAALADAARARATAATAARAVALFDQYGCVSPQVIFVERGSPIEPRAFADLLLDALDDIHAELPRGELRAADAAALRELVTRAEFRAIAGEPVETLEAAGGTVIYDAAASFDAACAHRTVRVVPVEAAEHALESVAPYRDVLQSAALAGFGDERAALLAARLAAAGVTRITDFEQLPFPRAAWHHDGRGPLRELARFVDWETPPEARPGEG